MNKPILCCLKIKPATLLVGLIDLTLQMSMLAALFASYSRPDVFDHYYANSLSLVSSSSAAGSPCLPPSSSYKSSSLDLGAADQGSLLQLTSLDNDDLFLTASSSSSSSAFKTGNNYLSHVSVNEPFGVGNNSHHIAISSKFSI
jgi:hypothetical protein